MMKVISNNEKALRFRICLNTMDDETCEDIVKVIGNADSEEDAANKLAEFMVNVGIEDGDVVRVY